VLGAVATVLPALSTHTNRAEPEPPMVSVHRMVIQVLRSGPSGVEAMVGEPELAYARARSVSEVELSRVRSRVTKGPALPLVPPSGILVWKMWVNLLVPCRVEGMYISYEMFQV